MNRFLLAGVVLGVVVVAAAAMLQASAEPAGNDGALITNADGGAWTIAAEVMPDDGAVGDFTHGILTVENATGSPVRLRGVELVDVVGSIALVDSNVASRGREILYVASDAAFPPEGADLALEPLADHVVTPFPEGEGAERNDEVVLHLQVPGGQRVAGYAGFCLEFTVEGQQATRRACNDHAFYACRDVDGPECGPRSDGG